MVRTRDRYKGRDRDGDPEKDGDKQAETERGISWRQSPPVARTCPGSTPPLYHQVVNGQDLALPEQHPQGHS